MRNLKHSLAAFLAVAMVGSLAAKQASLVTNAKADRAVVAPASPAPAPAVLAGDGEGDTPETAENQETQEEKKIPEKGYVLITENVLNVRSEANQESEMIGQLSCAQEVQISGQEGDWYKISFGDQTGYVFAEFITESYEEAQKAYLENFAYEIGSANAGGVNIRDGIGTDGTNVIDQLDEDDKIVILERLEDGWLKVYYGDSYDLGYMLADYVTVENTVPKETILSLRKDQMQAMAKPGVISAQGSSVNVRAFPNDSAEIVDSLSDGTKCSIVTKGSNWTKISVNGRYAYVKSDYIQTEEEIQAQKQAAEKAAAEKAAKEAAKKAAATVKTKKSVTRTAKAAAVNTESKTSAPAGSKGQAIVEEAKKYLGVRYVYGGTSPSGFDCSGLVQYVCRKNGISVSRSSKEQYHNGASVSRSELQPGDLVFFSKGAGISHVGIYAGNGSVIHSPSPGKTVCYTSLSKMSSYSTYVGARRVS